MDEVVAGDNSSMIAYAWFIWDKSYKGEPMIDWIKDVEVQVPLAVKQEGGRASSHR